MNDFTKVMPEEQGVSSSDIADFLNSIEKSAYDLHSFQLFRNDSLIFSRAAAPFTLDSPHRAFSATKGIIAIAVLIAIQEKHFTFSSPVIDFFKDDLPVDLDEKYRRLTVYDMLTMQVGQESDEAFLRIIFENQDENLIRAFFETEIVNEPGTVFFYNNAVPQMLCYIVERASGIPFENYLKSRICDPLEIDISIQYSNGGEYEPSTSVLSSNALLKIGILLLQNGKWKNRRILRKDLASMACAAHVPTQDKTSVSYGNKRQYGMQIWRNAFGGSRLDGGMGQFVLILPEHEIVAVFMSNDTRQDILLDAFYEHILINCRWKPLKANHVSRDRLLLAEERFNLAPLDVSSSSSVFSRVSGFNYQFPDNSLKIQSFSLSPGNQDCIQMKVEIAGQEINVSCGLDGKWESNPHPFLIEPDTSHLNMIYTMNPEITLLSGGWESDHVFIFKIRSPASMGESIAKLDFGSDRLRISIPQKVCLGKANFKDSLILESKMTD